MIFDDGPPLAAIGELLEFGAELAVAIIVIAGLTKLIAAGIRT